MEEINLHELLDFFKERIMLFLIIILTILVSGSIYSVFLKKPLYQSNVTIVLVSEDGLSSNQTYTQSDVQLNKSLVGTYSEIIKSRKVIEQVIKNLSLDLSVKELQDEITIASVKDTEIIKVSVLDENRTSAANIANEVAKVFSSEIKKLYQIQNVFILDAAEEADIPFNINLIKDLAIYIAIGFALGLAMIFINYYFDTTIKSSTEIENKFKLPVFSVIPKVKR